MIHFCLVHVAYHLHCRLPRSHWFRLRVIAFLFATASLTLQFEVLLRPRSSRYCSQPLLLNLVGSIIFTFIAIGFAALLLLMEPVPWVLKKLFVGFSVASLGEGLCTTVLTLMAADCAKTTPELYYLSVLLSASSSVSTAFFASQGLIWLASVARSRQETKPRSWYRGPSDPVWDQDPSSSVTRPSQHTQTSEPLKESQVQPKSAKPARPFRLRTQRRVNRP